VYGPAASEPAQNVYCSKVEPPTDVLVTTNGLDPNSIESIVKPNPPVITDVTDATTPAPASTVYENEPVVPLEKIWCSCYQLTHSVRSQCGLDQPSIAA
jgi:hypothetical protein